MPIDECPVCHKPAPPEALFCRRCGAALGRKLLRAAVADAVAGAPGPAPSADRSRGVHSPSSPTSSRTRRPYRERHRRAKWISPSIVVLLAALFAGRAAQTQKAAPPYYTPTYSGGGGPSVLRQSGGSQYSRQNTYSPGVPQPPPGYSPSFPDGHGTSPSAPDYSPTPGSRGRTPPTYAQPGSPGHSGYPGSRSYPAGPGGYSRTPGR
jgi:hypothetical protein